ncbi:MAG: hypothetical protein K0R29_693 [Pseudobdellovibrio sp.]|nr:hypothetical protein [Pseudobdellovibrio sp.]
MSALDSLKDRGKGAAQKIIERVRESSVYAQMMDRYENLTPAGQKIAKLATSVLILLIVLFIPLSNLSTSYTNISMFEEERDLIRELFRTYRETSSNQNLPVPPPSDSLMSMVAAVIQRAELLPEQNIGISEGPVEGRMIPGNLVSNVMQVRLAKLNLKQIVDIGGSLVGISDSVKMKDIAIVANATDTRYYDVTYKLYSLKVPEATPEPMPEPEKKPGRNSAPAEGADE